MSEVIITLWFDTEDYITPIADDGAKGVAELLTRIGVKGTFKVVGEKARMLKNRNRQDVIDALKKHDVGYHTDFHSVHPTVAEFLRDRDWDEGVEEFHRREQAGLRDVERVFNTRCSCYGQPGGSWAPHVFEALHKWGVPLYLDDGGHVGLNDEPFWYCGILNVFRVRKSTTRLGIRPGIEPLAEATRKFDAIYDRLHSTGGIVSIYYHPLEWVTEVFWDGVNFAKGANPPRSEWKPAPVTKPEVVAQRFAAFEQYVKHMQKMADVRFVTGREIVQLYPDKARGHRFTSAELLDVSRSVKPDISFVRLRDWFLSPAEVLSLISGVAATMGKTRTAVLPHPLYGPRKRATDIPSVSSVSSQALVRAAQYAHDALQKDRHVPEFVPVDGVHLSPGDFLLACGRLSENILRGGAIPPRIAVEPARRPLEAEIGADERMWGWVIFPESFRAPKILELAKLQTWTLKPATRG